MFVFQLGVMYAYVRSYEIVGGIYLLDIRNALVDFILDGNGLFRIAVV